MSRIPEQEVKLNSRQKLEILFCLAGTTVRHQSGFGELQSLYFLQGFTSSGFFVVVVIAGISGLVKLRAVWDL